MREQMIRQKAIAYLKRKVTLGVTLELLLTMGRAKTGTGY